MFVFLKQLHLASIPRASLNKVHTSDMVSVKRWGLGCPLTEVALSEIPVQQISLRKGEGSVWED